MAIEHDLFLAELPADEVASLVVRDGQQAGLIDPDLTVEAVLGDGALLRSGAVLWVSQVESSSQHPVLTDLQIAANSSVTFRFVGSSDWDTQMAEMIWVTIDLLLAVPGDAVLSFQFEAIRLLRRGGDLWLSDDDKFWTPARRQMVTIPYQRSAMRFP